MGKLDRLHRDPAQEASDAAGRRSGCATGSEVYLPYPRSRAAGAGRALHGLRHPVLPPGLPARQPDSRLERSGLPRPLAARRSIGCTRPTTSRSSPAGCARRRAKASCVLGINDDPVTIKCDRGCRSSSARSTKAGSSPRPPAARTGKRVAVVGSGPAGLAAADQLNRAGHLVTVFERADRIGGLLRYGIPEFKLEKRFLDRRLALMEQEGVVFRHRRQRRRRRAGRRRCGASSTPSSSPAARRAARSAGARAASCRASTSRWTT